MKKKELRGSNMMGTIIGDVIGSPFEKKPQRRFRPFFLFTRRSHFSDDSVLATAVASSILTGTSYQDSIRSWAKRYPRAGYGKAFREWMKMENPLPYNSYGNGSMMRVAPVGWAFNDEDKVLEEAKKSAECTHSHVEGIKGAQAVALAIYMAKFPNMATKQEIKDALSSRFGYNLDLKIADLPDKFCISCQETLPICMTIFMETDSFEEAIIAALKLGGDVDTNAAIVGSIAEAYYGTVNIPESYIKSALDRLPKDLAMTTLSFIDYYIDSGFKYRFSESFERFGVMPF